MHRARTVNSSQLRKGDFVLVEAGHLDSRRRRGHRGRGHRRRERPSPANPRRSCANPAATALRSPAARACCPTGWSCASRANPGDTFLDRMIAMVEGAKRQRTPNEIALSILLATLTLIFLLAWRRCCRFRSTRSQAAGQGRSIGITVLVALLVCLIPTTIGGLLSAIGIAGMDRMIQANVDRDVRTRGRSRRRRRRAAARQDRHDHAGQPPGCEVLARARRRDRAGTRRRRATGLARRRDARGPLDRRAGQAEVRPSRARPERS